jgi:sigma-B regulation protein RsbU (phosphoserine phosphatase)
MLFFRVASSIYVLTGAVLFFLSLIVFRENTRNRLYQVTGLLLLCAALGTFAAAFRPFLGMTDPITWGNSIAGRLTVIWHLFFPFLLAFAFLFPREHAVFKRHPSLLRWLFIPYIFRLIVVLLFPKSLLVQLGGEQWRLDSFWGPLLNPLFMLARGILYGLEGFVSIHGQLFEGINLLYSLAAIVVLFRPFDGGKGSLFKRRVQLVRFSLAISIVVYALAHTQLAFTSSLSGLKWGYAVTIVAILTGTISVCYAIIRHQFLSLRVVFRRGLVFFIASIGVVGLYLILHMYLERFAPRALNFELPLFQMGFLLLAVFLFQPFLNRIEHWVNQFIRPLRKEYFNVVREVSQRLWMIIDPRELLLTLRELLQEHLDITSATLLTVDERGGLSDRFARDPDRPGWEVSRYSEILTLVQNLDRPVRAEHIRIQLNRSREIDLFEKLDAFFLLPLRGRYSFRGLLAIGRPEDRRPLSSEARALLDMIATHATISLENGYLYHSMRAQQKLNEELDVARDIQRMLLPQHIPSGPTFSLAARNRPSRQVGGDFYDFIMLPNESIGFAIGDISGKGIPASILMSNLQASFRAAALNEMNPNVVIGRVNRHLSRTTAPEKYATFWYGIFNPQNRELIFCNAGHNYPLLKHADGRCVPLTNGAPVIGVDEDIEYQQHRLQLTRGDTLILYTDGVTEAMNPEGKEYGEHRLLHILEQDRELTADTFCADIVENVSQFTGYHDPSDDLTLVVLCVS